MFQGKSDKANFRSSCGFRVITVLSMAWSFCSTSYAAAKLVPKAAPRLVAYVADYKGVSFTDYSKQIDFTRITHINLAFGNPPKCDGKCTSRNDIAFAVKDQADADVKRMVATAHASGVKVLLSIGGGGGDQLIIQFYNAGLSKELVASLNKYVTAHDLDGVDVDIEDPSNMGAPFAEFVTTLVAKLRPKGLLVTAAVAKYLQSSMPDSALHQFDFINVMNYSSYTSAVTALQFYAEDKKVPKNKIVLGVPFFGSNDEDTKEEDFRTILAAYPNAWRVDMVGGGSLDDGMAFHYVGATTMALETLLGKQYGGVMVWETMGDASTPHSLFQVIRGSL